MKLLPSRLPIVGAVLLLLWTTSPALALNEPAHALVNTEAASAKGARPWASRSRSRRYGPSALP